MHNVQKKAVIAIISMIESGLREIRAVLSDGTLAPEEAPRAQSIIQPRPDSPLSDAEEMTLEQMMEHNRQQMLKESEEFLQRSYQQAEPDHFYAPPGDDL